MTQVAALIDAIGAAEFVEFSGRVTAIGQGAIAATGPLSFIGDMCSVGEGGDAVLAEVVAVDSDGLRLIALGRSNAVRPGTVVRRSASHSAHRSGDDFAGRAVDAFGHAIDGGPAVTGMVHRQEGRIGVLSKTIVLRRVVTGFRAIDALLPIAQGQRIGIFAASGVGKTTLIEQLSLHVPCDHVVACLIGERGREVERLWRLHRDSERGDRSTIVAATSDESASARVRALYQALALCEAWRDAGRHVVLFVDSITRFAMAQREIGLAAGEPPSVRSYTPNVFAALPGIVERCGAVKGGGAITAVFTVLSETDDVDDPIVETMKAILDGHIVLSRKLAEKGRFPAIDIAASVSRVSDQVLDTATRAAAQHLRRYFAEYEEARAMIESGIYQPGSSKEIDRAIGLQPRIAEFLQQDKPDMRNPAATDKGLVQLVSMGAQA